MILSGTIAAHSVYNLSLGYIIHDTRHSLPNYLQSCTARARIVKSTFLEFSFGILEHCIYGVILFSFFQEIYVESKCGRKSLVLCLLTFLVMFNNAQIKQ